MKQSIYLVILFVTLSNLQLSYCQSERWVYLGNTDGVEIYIDKNTIKYDNIFHNYKIFTKAVNFDKTFQISLSYISCENRTQRVTSTTFYDKNGNYLGYYDSNEFFDIIPESNGEKILEYLCK